jgi:hypothetical protein
LDGNPIDPAAPSEFSLGSPARIGVPKIADPYFSAPTPPFSQTVRLPRATSSPSHGTRDVRVIAELDCYEADIWQKHGHAADFSQIVPSGCRNRRLTI